MMSIEELTRSISSLKIHAIIEAQNPYHYGPRSHASCVNLGLQDMVEVVLTKIPDAVLDDHGCHMQTQQGSLRSLISSPSE